MSYPSIGAILEEQGLTIKTAAPAQLKDVLWEALNRNLSIGIAYLSTFAEQVKTTGQRQLKIEDPNSPLGQQLVRLLGTDIARGICQERLGIQLGLYNCCAPVGAPIGGHLNMTIEEQISLQTGANC